jgi:hypothetical protein
MDFDVDIDSAGVVHDRWSIRRMEHPDTKEGALFYLLLHLHATNAGDDTELYVEALPYRYSYDSDKHKVIKALAPIIMSEAMGIERYKPPPRWKMLELDRVADFLSLASIPAGAGLLEDLESSKTSRFLGHFGPFIVAAASAGVGGIFGYYKYYHDGADYENPIFQSVLLNESIWISFVKEAKLCDLLKSVQAIDPELEKDNSHQSCERFHTWLSKNL